MNADDLKSDMAIVDARIDKTYDMNVRIALYRLLEVLKSWKVTASAGSRKNG